MKNIAKKRKKMQEGKKTKLVKRPAFVFCNKIYFKIKEFIGILEIIKDGISVKLINL